MPRPILVHLLPALFEPADLQKGIAVVMDVLRATSTMIQALANGAACVVPCSEIDEARTRAAEAAPGTVLLGGERGGLPIPGFDLGNSPAEYTPQRVRGKRIVFTTTNGTRALIRARQARRVLVGAISNLTAIVELLENESGPVHLVCAGTDGRITLEDVLCAGGIARCLHLSAGDFEVSDDATLLAVSLFESRGRDYDLVLESLRQSRRRNLIDCGLESDIALCAMQDQFDFVPELARDAWEVRRAADRGGEA